MGAAEAGEASEVGSNCRVGETTVWGCDGEERAGGGGEGGAEGGRRRCPMGYIAEGGATEATAEEVIGKWVPEKEDYGDEAKGEEEGKEEVGPVSGPPRFGPGFIFLVRVLAGIWGFLFCFFVGIGFVCVW